MNRRNALNYHTDRAARGLRISGRSTLILVSLAFTALLSACGRDSATAPEPAGTVTVSETSLSFGSVTAGSATTGSFRITADAANSGQVSGSVRLGAESDAVFSISSGGGDYSLAPGESQTVLIRFAPTAGGVSSTATVEVGAGASDLPCSGFGSGVPYYRFSPTALSEGTVTTNYKPFADSGVTVGYGTGRSHGSSPNWFECNSSGWIFNGNAIAESTVGYTFHVPNGVSAVEVIMGMEAESDCVQVLVEIDGTEHRTEDQSGCRTFRRTYAITPGTREIRIGTDQQGFCGADLHVNYVRFEFQGINVPPSDWN
ncbi:MAG: hypothetical protein R3E97_02640 [Candidatus Eisenbacteria bacterium]